MASGPPLSLDRPPYQPVYEQHSPKSPASRSSNDDEPDAAEDASNGDSGGDTDDQSVYSFRSSVDGPALLTEVDGRAFNTQNQLYFLPADEREFTRLDKQHLMLLIALPGLYAAPDIVKRVLAPEEGVQKRILDLGCGGGNWAIAMAEEFPHAEVVGVDLAPSTSRTPPKNCRFEFDDVNLGLPHYHGVFDVVHARCCANGLKDSADFINEIALCLKPGGVILLVEGDFQVYDEDLKPQEIALEGVEQNGRSWFARLLFEVYNTMMTRGSCIDTGMYIEKGLQDHPSFKETGLKIMHCNIGPWKRSQDAEENSHFEIIGTLMRQNALEFVRALRPLLVSEGYPPETVDMWIARTDDELNNLTHRMNTRWRYAWGIKLAPEEPRTSVSCPRDDPSPPFTHVADSVRTTPSRSSISEPGTCTSEASLVDLSTSRKSSSTPPSSISGSVASYLVPPASEDNISEISNLSFPSDDMSNVTLVPPLTQRSRRSNPTQHPMVTLASRRSHSVQPLEESGSSSRLRSGYRPYTIPPERRDLGPCRCSEKAETALERSESLPPLLRSNTPHITTEQPGKTSIHQGMVLASPSPGFSAPAMSVVPPRPEARLSPVLRNPSSPLSQTSNSFPRPIVHPIAQRSGHRLPPMIHNHFPDGDVSARRH